MVTFTYEATGSAGQVGRIVIELKSGGRDPSDNDLIDLMVKHPDLIQRPIIEK